MPEDISEHRKNSKVSEGGRPIEVTCAIIEKNGWILAAQRGPGMTMPFKWEFPGGKINPGETAEDCIIREINEELGVEIQIKTTLQQSTHSYPDLHVRLHPFVCRITNGRIAPKEHRAVQWTTHDHLPGLQWAEADVAVVKSYLEYCIGKQGL
ncbi:MAG: (deoxy)nucleoside triphosphate pyrophosphohydrolase [Thermodesulfobacteriota bacterium]|uniref:(deoxy)nucleoside triphosphate pyrophosphohydrolase n=1 Tax=Desulfosalsimonas sp. TaxID=3073848 RepID=UPI003970EECC